jgi:hypothetical protein
MSYITDSELDFSPKPKKKAELSILAKDLLLLSAGPRARILANMKKEVADKLYNEIQNYYLSL